MDDIGPIRVLTVEAIDERYDLYSGAGAFVVRLLGFPRPIAELSDGPRWRVVDVDRWASNHLYYLRRDFRSALDTTAAQEIRHRYAA
jgi:hypothetical protein